MSQVDKVIVICLFANLIGMFYLDIKINIYEERLTELIYNSIIFVKDKKPNNKEKK